MSTTHRRPRSPIWAPLIAILLVAAGAWIAADSYGRGECQQRVNVQVASALAQRDTANRAITAAQRVLVTARLDPERGGTGITPREADEAYLRALDDLEAARAANPLAPAETC